MCLAQRPMGGGEGSRDRINDTNEWIYPNKKMIQQLTKIQTLACLTLLATGCSTTLYPGFQGLQAGEPIAASQPASVDKNQSGTNQETATFDHSNLQNILQKHVDADGWVDYAAIKADPSGLDAYLTQLSTADFSKLGSNEQLALLINAYNAFTLKLIVENYPVKSIKDIRERDRWEAKRWNLGGRIYSLNNIEHDVIRKNFNEPRIHFALVCAAIGCPPLRNEVFTGENLEKQLASQTDYVHTHGTWLKFDSENNRVKLTKLYNWYGSDFEKTSGSVINFIRTNSASFNSATNGRNPRVSWLGYDWTLNDVKKKVAR